MADRGELFTLSTHHHSLLPELVDRYLAWLDANPETNLADLCYTANRGRRQQKWRIATVVTSLAELRGWLARIAEQLAAGQQVCADPDAERSRAQVSGMQQASRSYLASSRSDLAALDQVAELFRAGIDVDWREFYTDSPRQRISLPTSPLLRTQFWMGGARDGQRSGQPATGPVIAVPELCLAELDRATPPAERLSWLVLHDQGELDLRVVAALRAAGHEVLEVVPAPVFSAAAELIAFDRNDPASFAALAAELTGRGVAPQRLLWLWGRDSTAGVAETYDPMVHLLQQVAPQLRDQTAVLSVVTEQAWRAAAGATATGLAVLAAGTALVAAREFKQLRSRQIDLGYPAAAATAADIDRLIAEASAADGPEEVAHVGGSRLLPGLRQVKLAEAPTPIRRGGCYLLTGGLGGIGLALAKHLVHDCGANVVLTGSSALTADESDPRVRALAALRSRGQQAEYHQVPVSDEAAMSALLDDLEQRLGVIDGVFHLAGADVSGLLQFSAPADADRVLDPKVRGTQVLERVLAGRQTQFLMLFSSVTALVAPPSMAGYVSACRFLDARAVASSRAGVGPRVISVNWDSWQGTGMAARRASEGVVDEQLQQALGQGIACPTGVQLVDQLLAAGGHRYVVTARPMAELRADLEASFETLGAPSKQSDAGQPRFERPQIATPLCRADRAAGGGDRRGLGAGLLDPAGRCQRQLL